jgi:succinate dehydrogenase / fumarate reductase cytochrome b subunit
MSKLKYALFTGCTARESTPEQLSSTLAVAKALDIELVLLDEATCCGASHLQDFDEFLSLVLNARNICYAEKHGLEMVTICNTCQLNTVETKRKLDSDAALKARVNEKLAEVGLEYKGTSRIRHFQYALIEDFGLENLANAVKVPLSNYNVAPFYGCHNIRPSHTHEADNMHENPYNPKSLERLIEALEGNAVDYEDKNRCCGFHVELQAPQTANRLSANALLGAKDAGADMVITPCPLCQIRMDVQQHNISKEAGRETGVPVLHFQQLIGLALGIDAKELGLDRLVTEFKSK